MLSSSKGAAPRGHSQYVALSGLIEVLESNIFKQKCFKHKQVMVELGKKDFNIPKSIILSSKFYEWLCVD